MIYARVLILILGDPEMLILLYVASAALLHL